jgi:hypothetical protein
MPYNYYLKYLITLNLSNKKIIEKINSLGFDVSKDRIEGLKKGMMIPKIFKEYADGENVDEKYILKYANKFGIKEIWRYKLHKKPRDFKDTFLLLEDRNARLIPVILTIKGDKFVHESMRKLGYEYSKKSIELMLYYFFNIERTSLKGWKEYFKDIPKAKELLDQPLDYIRYKFGLSPKMDYPAILQDLMHLSYFKSKENLSFEDKEHINIAKKLADVAIKAGEKLQKYGGKDTETFLDDVIIEFENAEINIPDIKEISEEEHEEGPQLNII